MLYVCIFMVPQHMSYVMDDISLTTCFTEIKSSTMPKYEQYLSNCGSNSNSCHSYALSFSIQYILIT